MHQIIISLLCFLFCVVCCAIPIWLIFSQIKINIVYNDIENSKDTNLKPLDIVMTICILVASIILYNFIW